MECDARECKVRIIEKLNQFESRLNNNNAGGTTAN